MKRTLEDFIGETPLVRLQRLPGEANAQRGNVVLAKLEGNNPAGSVKDRPAISMIARAEQRGEKVPKVLVHSPRRRRATGHSARR